MFYDHRHKQHEQNPKCAWCGEIHKTYIMELLKGNKSQGLMTLTLATAKESA